MPLRRHRSRPSLAAPATGQAEARKKGRRRVPLHMGHDCGHHLRSKAAEAARARVGVEMPAGQREGLWAWSQQSRCLGIGNNRGHGCIDINWAGCSAQHVESDHSRGKGTPGRIRKQQTCFQQDMARPSPPPPPRFQALGAQPGCGVKSARYRVHRQAFRCVGGRPPWHMCWTAAGGTCMTVRNSGMRRCEPATSVADACACAI